MTRLQSSAGPVLSRGIIIRPGRPVVRTTFQFVGTLVPNAAQPIEVLERQARSLVCDWLEGKFPERLSPSAREGESFEIDVHGQRLECVAISEDRLWSIRLIQPDTPFRDRPAVPGRTWTTEIALVRESAGVRFAIRVVCASLRFAGEPVTLTRPRIVIDLGSRFTLREARPIRAYAWRPQSETELLELQELLTSPERGLPVYLLTTPDERQLNMHVAPFMLDHESLARRVQGLAHVVTMPWELGYKWTELVGKPWSAYWGAVRTYRPGLDFESELPTDHPLSLAEGILAFEYKGLTMERAFEEFLVDRAFEHSAGRHVNWGPCLFYVDARRRRAEMARSSATEDSEWRTLYEEEIASLGAKIEQLEHERDDALSIADSADKDREFYVAENQRLRARIDALGFQLTQKTGQSVDATAPLPNSYDDLPDWVDSQLVGRLILHPRALNALKKAMYENVGLVAQALLLLANEYRNMRLGHEDAKDSYDRKVRELGLRHDGSITEERASEQGDEYFVLYPIGSQKRRFLELHLRKGTSKDKRICLAVYFFWDDETQQVVVGWLPSHLDNRQT
ncbi:MAG: hypothetical protein HRU71_13030 [Planctomycetia bacterium]|nr:MAG: hypothetical protein HRU71_13030 [Planctomycetia bacterium]